MTIEELKNQFSLLPSTVEAVKKVESITGKAIRFEVVEELTSFALLKAARSHMPQHVIYLKDTQLQFINHLIIHECYHLFRFWSVPLEERKSLSYQQAELEKRKNKWIKELGRKSDMLPPQIFDMWNNSLGTLFYNAVTDTRIELAMYHDYEEVRPEQLAALKAQEENIKKTFDKKLHQRMPIPPSLFLSSSAMNYVFLNKLTPIIGKNWKKMFKGQQEIVSLGNKLLRAVPEQDDGLLGDIDILNKWAIILELPGINWVPFDQVPFGYEYQY